jgi:TonB family protein
MDTANSFARCSWRKPAAICAATIFLAASVVAQEPACKSKGGDVKVVYPELARRMKISGMVRLQLQLTNTGSVREAKVLGGNPILVSAAQDAVKQAKFEGGETCVAVFHFKE